MPPPAPKSRPPRYTATSYVCDRPTRELGEDYPELKKVARAYRLLERRLVAAQPVLRSRRALSTVMDFSLALADANHDESLGSTILLAQEAFVEARVVKIARPPAFTQT
jgi:hypothetical protein